MTMATAWSDRSETGWTASQPASASARRATGSSRCVRRTSFSRGPGRRQQGGEETLFTGKVSVIERRIKSATMGAGQLDLRRRRPGRADHRPQSLQTGEPAGDRISHQAGRLRDRTDQRSHQHVRVHLQRRRRPVRDFYRHTGHTGRAVAVALPVAQRRHRRGASRRNAANYNTTFLSQPHPWRTKRATIPASANIAATATARRSRSERLFHLGLFAARLHRQRTPRPAGADAFCRGTKLRAPFRDPSRWRSAQHSPPRRGEVGIPRPVTSGFTRFCHRAGGRDLHRRFLP